MNGNWGCLLLLICIVVPHINSGYVKSTRGARGRLNEYISHYETLNYDTGSVHADHRRVRRSITQKNPHLHLKFDAHGRRFHIRLRRDITTFSDNLEVVSTDGPVDVDLSHVYEGRLVDDPLSVVHGSVIDGVFEGKIITDRDTFYVEHAKHYFPQIKNGSKLAVGDSIVNNDEELNRFKYSVEGESSSDKKEAGSRKNNSSRRYSDVDLKLDFHSVIYKDEHVDDPYAHKRKGHVSGCGITEEVQSWMDQIQNSAIEVEEVEEEEDESAEEVAEDANEQLRDKASVQKQMNRSSGSVAPAEELGEFPLPYQKYSKEANVLKHADKSQSAWHKESHERVKRAARPREDNKNTCSLYIQTDPLIWRHIREGIVDRPNGKSMGLKKSEVDEKIREEILSLIAHHTTAVNYIYRNTKFDGRVEHRNIRFEVQRIKIDDDSACSESYTGESNSFCMENIDVSNFLNIHSLGNHEDFCLAYVFTYRDFTGGTLGLAWVASASGASGGICEKYKTYTETVGGLYQSTKRSLNTGIITFVNYNSRVPPKVSQLTLAHEIGHNFGSPHDYPQGCRPGGLNGNYIMFASATSGDRPNNSKFSTCSIRNISNVLDAIEDNKKRNCFQASEGAFCGNKIVESGEECDCGFNDEECVDKCCYPRQINEYDLSLNATARGCTRRKGTQCSPSQGPCCRHDRCTFHQAHENIKCREETECSWSASCNGTTAECPEPKPRDDKTKCNNGTQLCISGECSGSICLLWNMTECFLTSNIIPNIDKRKLCDLACQQGNDTNSCRSTSEFDHLYDLPKGGISLRPGSPCDNFQGYCDVFLRCRAVDAEGPLVRLKNLLFNKETLFTVANWITDNWYIVVLIGIGFVIFMGIFIKCCAVHTPSSNPKKPPARRISDTLRRPMNTLRRMRHPHAQPGPRPMARSIPPPQNEQQRSRSGGRLQGPVPGPSSGGGGGGGRSRGEGRDAVRADRERDRSGRPPARPPPHGYGDVRGQQYYPPKGSVPPANYNRPMHPEAYAEAYQPPAPPLLVPSGSNADPRYHPHYAPQRISMPYETMPAPSAPPQPYPSQQEQQQVANGNVVNMSHPPNNKV